MSHIKTGQIGEDLACEYIKNKGYKIIERNHRQKWGELDIIAAAPNKTLIFLEVKTLTNPNFAGLKPEDHLTGSKLEKLKRTAELYANNNAAMIKDKRGWQIDLAAILIPIDVNMELPLKELGTFCRINYYENI
ncbi:MAG: YraN family protein [Candidatus Pacebacteria bacterium]|nr:YraN family protein [Candidatus Paceibacterota bacterium]